MTRYFTFDTTHHALWAEQLAQEELVGAQVVPAPPEAGARCDLALEVLAEDADRLADLLRGREIPFAVYP